jgi:hypothetical protein
MSRTLIKEDTGVIGEVGVDSGQVIVMDYDNRMKYRDTEMMDRRVYKHKDGTLLQYKSSAPIEKGAIAFPNYAAVIPKYGKSMNDINAAGEAEALENEINSELSYAGACSTTLSDKGYGFLEGKTAFVTRTLYGDGGYDVLNDGKVITVNFNFSDGTDDDVEEEVPVGEVDIPSGAIMITDPCYIGQNGEWNGFGTVVETSATKAKITACLDKDGGMVMVKIEPIK